MKTKKSSVRRSLLVSATALVLTVAMLIGTTFAWFTDSVTSGVNKIQAGNLKVELRYKSTKDGSFETVTKDTNVFKTDTLWEPGHVEYAVLKISNVGSLALQYKLAINVAGESKGTVVIDGNEEELVLSKYLKYAVVNGDLSADDRATMLTAAEASGVALSQANVGADGHLLPTSASNDEDSKIMTLVVWMPETVGNEANYKTGTEAPTINLGINLVATQYQYEQDSFDEKYDATADGTPDNGKQWEGATIAQATASVKAGSDVTIPATGITATIPADSVDTSAVTEVTLTMQETNTPSTITVGLPDNENALTYEVSLKDQGGNAVTATSGKYFTFDLQLKPNLDITSFKHHETDLDKVNSITANDQYVYNASTGILTFSTDDFSPFTATWKFDGGMGTKENPYLIATEEHLMLLEDNPGYYKLSSDIVIHDELYLSKSTWNIDLNGHSITLDYAPGVKPNNGSVLYIGGSKGVLNITDSSEDMSGTVYGSTQDIAKKVTSAVRAGNLGKLNIYGGNFVGRSTGTSCIFVFTSPVSSSKAIVNIYGGTFKTLSPYGDGKYYVLNHQDNASAGCTITVYGGKFYNYNPGVTVVDPVNAKTGKIVLATGATTAESKEGSDTVYTVTSNS